LKIEELVTFGKTINLTYMSYTFNKVIAANDFNHAVEKVTDGLKAEGFGVITTIDMKKTMKNKLDVDFRNYVILGACHPQSAYAALQSESRIGVFLPCNVVVQELDNGTFEVAAVDPIASMGAVENDKLREVATKVQQKLSKVVSQLH
jgi:uncharacterized protein (DUF302 family)